MLRDLKKRGYKITIFFLWAPTVEITGWRVKERVLKGGHNIPEADQLRRFARSVVNLTFAVRESFPVISGRKWLCLQSHLFGKG
jgi:predicted ABC-type ATPase